jgi:hypothetical protein
VKNLLQITHHLVAAEVRIQHLAPWHDNHVITSARHILRKACCLSQHPLDAVALHRTAELLPYGKSKAHHSQPVGNSVHYNILTCGALAFTENSLKI